MFDLIHANRRLQASNPSTPPVAATSISTLSPPLWWSLRDAAKVFKDNAVTQAVAGDAIQRINPKGSENRYLMQATLADRPLLDSINGQPAALYDGLNDFFVTDDWIAAHAQPFTIIYGGLFTNAAASVGNAMGGTGFNLNAFGAGGSGNYQMYSEGSVANMGARDALPHCFLVEFNGAASTLQVDSGAPVTAPVNPGTRSFTGGYFYLGSTNDGGSQFKAGKFTDFALIDGLIPTATKPGIIKYVQQGLGL